MKFEHNWGDSWRGTFKKLLWFSVIAFEVTAVVLIWLVVTSLMPQKEAHAFFIIAFSLVATLLNTVIHCVWGCIVYMFEDIARTREVTCAMAEYTIEKDKLLHPEVIDTLDDKEPPKSTSARSNAEEKKVYRSVADRSASDSKKPQETWVCSDCGALNSSTTTFCKDCGKYK